MDVWSLGLIFASMLKDVYTIFGNIPHEYYDQGIHMYIYAILGYPTAEDWGGLGIKYWVNGNAGNFHENLIKLMPLKDKYTIKWMPIVEAMLNYHPQKRMKIKDLLNHELFKKHFEPYVFRLPEYSPQTSKMERISINFPNGFENFHRTDMVRYCKTMLGLRRSILDDRRRDLVVLAHNLEKATSVPLQIWINIFMLANTKPIMYLLLSRSHRKSITE